MVRIGIAVALAALTVNLVAPAAAMTVSPTQLEMLSIGAGAHARITVTNTDDEPLAVEAILSRATLDEAGVPTTSAASDDFLVMPPQAIIAPGGTQNFRVQWLGDPLIESSQTYLLYISQIPVKRRGTSIVQVVVSIGVMINVAPPQGVPSLHVVSTGIVRDRHGVRHPTVTVENPSPVHALFPQSSMQLSSGTWSEAVPSGLLSERLGIGLVQPGHRRRFVLPVELPPDVTSVRASIDFRPTR
jgi:P pilus assembly chaperone PapD